MKTKFYLLFLLSSLFFLLFSLPVFSQIKKANKHYEDFEYHDAIPLYLKVIKHEPQNLEAIQNLAHCYHAVGDYEKAEVFYAKALTLPNFDPHIPMLYGKVLKNNNKFDKAKEVFVVYATKHPDQKNAEDEITSCDKVKLWELQTPKRFEVTLAKDINSKLSDFSPAVYNKGLAFVSERHVDQIEGSTYGLTGNPFLAIYEAEQNGEDTFHKPKLFPGNINNDYHNGPIAFNGKYDEAFITRVDNIPKGKSFVNRPQLYFVKKEKEKWHDPVPFQHNSADYSLAHPSLSADGQMLFFVSDMPGGYGGKDIYVCKREGENWSKPENLGQFVNTEGDELFPYYRTKDSTLYFSSDGHIGYGGMDIFSARHVADRWGTVKNLKEPVNTSKDDFGVAFVNDTIGYISSNRPGGKGSDDIYRFKIVYDKELHSSITGIFLYSKLNPGANVYLKLLDENNVEVQRVKTNRFGEFFFENLKIDKDYVVVFDEKDIQLSDESMIFITNEKKDKVAVLIKAGKRFFRFRALAEEDYNRMPLMKEEDIKISSLNLFAQIYDKLPGDIPAGMEISILNDDGEVVYTTTTDAKGNFSIKDLPPDHNYTFKLKNDDLNAKIYIMDSKNEVVQVIEKDKKGFVFDKLAYDKARIALIKAGDTGLKPIQFFGQIYDKLPGDVPPGMQVYAMNDAGEIIAVTTVDEKGNFTFEKLPADKNYSFKLQDASLGEQIVIMNENKEVVETIKKNDKGNFVYERLAAIKTKLSELEASDAAFIDLNGRLFEKLPGDMPAGMQVYLVDDAGNIIATTTTDAKGNFTFEKLPADKNYSFKLKDNGAGANILILGENNEVVENIKKDKKGNFVYDKLAAEKTKVATKEASDATPMKLSGQLYQTLPGDMPAGMEVYAVNDAGEIVAIATLDAKGNFVFEKLPADKHYTFKMKDAPAEASIVIMNDKQEVVETIKKNKKGNFDFKALTADQMSLAKTDAKDDKLIRLKNEELKEVKYDSTKIFSVIYFDYDKSDITKNEFSSMMKELDVIADLLKKDPNLKVDLTAHTDSRGTTEYNQRLSDRRAKAAVSYLMLEGIKRNRINGKGLGESLPVAPNENPDGSDNPANRAKNRRAEIRLTK